MGMTIPQYLRTLRMRYAAELLKSSECNVTEAAMEVGYSSLSHFSQAFCQAIGCCPAVYSSSVIDRASTACAAFRSGGNEQISNQNQQLGERSVSGVDVLLESIR
jgi:AraC-like DNA-binding protein